MNKILVEISVGELLDKISILEIKRDKIKDTKKLKFINNEYSILKSQLDQNVKTDDILKKLSQSLKEINSKLWIIEDEKRLCEKNKDFGEKFIKLSRDVHFLNDDRAQIKLNINNHTGSKIKEIKEYKKYKL
jgi:predicted  nucleic acid-binding Zn-ribbon protein